MSDGVLRAQHSPFRIVPHRGQVAEYGSKPPPSKRWGVLHEHVAGSYCANDPSHFRPKPGSFASDSCALAGDADVLAGKAARYHVNTASPRPSVKGANVIPNRERREKAVILSGGKYAGAVGVDFDGADGSPPEQDASEYASTSACEKSQLM